MLKLLIAIAVSSIVGTYTVTDVSDKAVTMSNGGHLYLAQVVGTPHVGDKLTVVYLPEHVTGFIND
ncbi:hypothetical protein D3C87_914830 [compost metagenome]